MIARICTLVLIGFLSAPALSAALIVDVPDVEVQAGGTATVNVYIRSDDIAGDVLSEFLFDLRLTPIALADGSSLQFVDPGLTPEAYLSSADYLFNGVSDAVDLNQAASFPDTVDLPNDTLTIEDAAFSGIDAINVPVSNANDTHLLVQFQLQHFMGGNSDAEVTGDTFDLALVEPPNFADLPLFVDADGFDVLGAGSAGEYALSSGTVTIVSAVPEPSGFAAIASIAMLGWGVQRRRRRG